MLKSYMNMLNMDANNFYPMLISILALLLPMLVGFIKGIIAMLKQQSPRKIFNLYCKRETDIFYVIILLWEVLGIIIGVYAAIIIDIVIKHVWLCNGAIFKWEIELLIIISIEVSCALSIILVKSKWVRKRLIGDEKGRRIIAYSITFINFGIMFDVLNSKVISFAFFLLYLINEIEGLIHFQGRYVKYDFSSMRIYLKNGEKIICEHIEKAKCNKDFIIIEEKNTCTVLLYDKIEKVEYCGPPKFILTENHLEELEERFQKKFAKPVRELRNKIKH